MTSKELIQKLDSHMRVNKITRKSVADKLGVTSAEVGRKLAADNCGLREFIALLDAVGVIWFTGVAPLVQTGKFEGVEGNTSLASDHNGGSVMMRTRSYDKCVFVRP